MNEAIIGSDNSEIPKKKKNLYGLWIIISKFGLKIVSLLAKFTKFGLAGISFASYAYLYSWQFAAMIITMIFVHEYGHFYAMKQKKMKTKGIYLIPFFGGAAVADEDFKTREDEAYIALMGPWFGFGISLITGLIYFITDNPIFAAGASWMAMVNLLNLLPVNPLDGGRVLKSIAFSINNVLGFICLSIGLGVLAFLAFFLKIGLFGVLLIISILELIFEYKTMKRNKIGKIINEEAKQIIENALKEDGYSDYSREHLEKSYNKLKEDGKKYEQKPTMNKSKMLLYMFLYAFTCIILFLLMNSMNHIPGAAAAMEALR